MPKRTRSTTAGHAGVAASPCAATTARVATTAGVVPPFGSRPWGATGSHESRVRVFLLHRGHRSVRAPCLQRVASARSSAGTVSVAGHRLRATVGVDAGVPGGADRERTGPRSDRLRHVLPHGRTDRRDDRRVLRARRRAASPGPLPPSAPRISPGRSGSSTRGLHRVRRCRPRRCRSARTAASTSWSTSRANTPNLTPTSGPRSSTSRAWRAGGHFRRSKG